MSTTATHELVPFTDAATRIAERMRARDCWIVTIPPSKFAAAAQRLGRLHGAVVYAENGTDTVCVAANPTASAALALGADAIGPYLAGVATVPKTVRRKHLARAFGRQLPGDEAQDVLLIEGGPDEGRYVWPAVFVEAVAVDSPEDAALIRASGTPGTRRWATPADAMAAMLAAAELLNATTTRPTNGDT